MKLDKQDQGIEGIDVQKRDTLKTILGLGVTALTTEFGLLIQGCATTGEKSLSQINYEKRKAEEEKTKKYIKEVVRPILEDLDKMVTELRTAMSNMPQFPDQQTRIKVLEIAKQSSEVLTKLETQLRPLFKIKTETVDFPELSKEVEVLNQEFNGYATQINQLLQKFAKQFSRQRIEKNL